MSKFKYMPILRTGTFTDKNKKVVTITEADLDKVVENTDLSKEPQFVIEHPVDDSVGFGTIEKLVRVGSYLFALPKTVDEKFKSAVNSGKFPGRSCALDEKSFGLKSIGFLPPQIAPAVSGLGDYSFSSAESANKLNLFLPGVESHFAEITNDKYEFAEYEVSSWPFRTIRVMFRNLKNKWIELYGKEEADKIFPEWDIEESGNAPVIWDSNDTEFSSNKNKDGEMINQKFDTSKIADPSVRAAYEALQTLNEQQSIQLQAATKKISDAEAASNRSEVLAFCESEEMKTKVLPADKDKVVNLLLSVKEKGVIEFSAADNTKVQLNTYEFLKETLKKLPNVIEFGGEIAVDGAAADKVPEYMQTAQDMAKYVN